MTESVDLLQNIQSLNTTVQVVQIIGIVLPLIGIIVLLRKEQSRSSMYLMLANVACVIVNSGYFLTLNSQNFDAAMLAFKMEYLGNILFFFFFAVFLCSYLQLGISKLFCCVWIAFETFEICTVWNDNYHDIVFNNIEFEVQERAEFHYLQIEAGWTTRMRYGIIAFALLIVLCYTIYRLIRMRKFSTGHKLRHLLAAELIVLVPVTIVQFYSFPYDIIPICSSFAVFIIILGVVSGEIFTVTDRGRQWVFEHIDNAVVILDPAYGYLDANECAKALFPELVKKPKNRKVPQQLIEIFQKEEDEFWLDEHHYKKMVYTLKQHKEIAGYSLIMMDDTKQYTLMEELVKEKDRAESANRAKSTFLSNMSHEIRTPMNAIVGMTEILMREELPDEQRGYLQNIKNSGAALLCIINDILDFSKIESGKLDFVEDNYEPMSMLNDLSMIFMNRIGEKQVELLFDIDKNLPAELYGDSLRLRQIIINIMNNAIKFTDEGYVRLTLTVEETGEDTVMLHVSIKDSGQGIKKEDMARLFQSFQQVNTKKNHEKEGTGLGLAITKQLVELMGGSIGVESTYGEGSEFYFDLPQKVVNRQLAATIKDEQPYLVCGKIKTVYVRDALKKLVEGYGMRYLDFDEAKAQNETADYLFVDCEGDLKELRGILRDPADKTAVCALCNPMHECLAGADCTLVNKPLYTLNFCRFMNKEGQAIFASTEDYLNFVAPEAQVLIVDDTEMNLKVALGLLQPLEMQIDTADGGRKALEMMKNKRYDLIFMDHMMPDMDGIETVQTMRKMEGDYFAQVPVIALTANAVVGAKEKFLAAGMNDLVGKPMDMKEVCGKIKKWLPKEKIQKQNVVKPASTEQNPYEVPVIEGIDSSVGLKNSGTLSLWLSLLGDFYRLIDGKSEKLENCLKDHDIRNYTIEVHALKNTARMIGAVELSERFYRMEQLGNDEDYDTIIKENPGVLELYRSYKPILAPYAKEEDEEKKQVSGGQLTEILEQLKMAMDTFDLDTADAAFAELKECELPEELEASMEKLSEYMADVAMEEVLAEADAMITKLRSI